MEKAVFKLRVEDDMVTILNETGTIINSEGKVYYFLPYWFETTNDKNVFIMHFLNNTPSNLKEAILTNRQKTNIMRKNIITTESKHLDITPVTAQVLNGILREKLLTGIVHFSFTKKDGTLRDAYGTLQEGKIAIPAGESSAPNPAVGTYFDVEANGWRSYIIANLIAIY